ncbi:MAG: 50S ribosomal protein L10 [Atopobiaceae bacterium]|nr:50S ribosomal protein L10 [Atopobiaceae bacterium]
MPAQSKFDMVEKINGLLDAHKGLFVVDYKGLSVKDSQEVRRALRAAGAEMKVLKNNLVRLALEQKGLPAIDDVLSDSNAFVFFGDDPVSAAKVVKEAAGRLNKLNFKGGIAEGAAITAEQAQAFADMPSREQLIAQIAGLINGFARSIAVSINEIPAGLARSINAIHEEKEAA